MRGIFRLDGPVYKAMLFIYYIIILNFLWILFSIPLVTIGASTTASFYVAGKIIRNEDVHEFHDFFKSFKQNFKQATIAWLIIAIICIIIYVNMKNIKIFYNISGSLGLAVVIVQIIIAIQFAIIAVNIFVLLSRYEFTLKNLFISAWAIGNKHFLSSIFAIITSVAIIFLGYRIVALIFFCCAGMISLCVYGILYKVIEKYNPENTNGDIESKQDNVQDKEEIVLENDIDDKENN